MANFAKVFNTECMLLKYKTAKCPDAMAETIKKYLMRGWVRWSDISKCRLTGFRVTMGIRNTYSIVRVTILEDGSVSYEGKRSNSSFIQNSNSNLLKRIKSTGIDTEKAKEILEALNKY